MKFLHRCTSLFLMFLIGVNMVYAQNNAQEDDQNNLIQMKGPDGQVAILKVTADDDGDGIENGLELNGFTYSTTNGFEAWDGDESKEYYITDPKRWSTDGDPYSDYMEVTGINMPAAIGYPENHPLVAARPVISIKMEDYDVIPIETISNSEGGDQSNSFTNEVSNTDEVSASVTVEASLNPFELVGGSVTASYSHTWTTTESSTNSFGSNWDNTRTTSPDQAARLKLRIYMQNVGSATALDVTPTVNLKIGEKTIATFKPSQMANVLTPPGTSDNRFPKNGTILVEEDENANYLIITLDELKAIQKGMPLSLEVVQVQAKVVRWNNDTQDWDSDIDWASFESEIDPVSMNFLVQIGNQLNKRYQVFAGTPYWDPQFSFEYLASLIMDYREQGSDVFLENRRYPEAWYSTSPSSQLLTEWENAGRPQSLTGLTMHRNTKLVMFSAGENPEPKIRLASYSGDFRKVLISVLANNFPIQSVIAKVPINGQMHTLELEQNEGSFYTNALDFEGVPDGPGTVIVKNARGDESSATITLPAIYKNAAEVKKYSSFLPDPGGDFWLNPGGEDENALLVYCLFFDPQTHEELAEPRSYLSFESNGEPLIFSDFIAYGNHSRFTFHKVAINPITLKIDRSDRTFVTQETIEGSGDFPSFYLSDVKVGNVTWSYPEFDNASTLIDLRSTPFHFAENEEVSVNQYGFAMIDKSRQLFELKRKQLKNESNNYFDFNGFLYDSLQLIRGYKPIQVVNEVNNGRGLLFNDFNQQDGYVNMWGSENLRVTDQLTMEAWIMPQDSGSNPVWGGVILNKEGEYEIYRQADGIILWAITNGSPGWKWRSTHFEAKENQWLHIAIVYDGNQVKTYFNGRLFHIEQATGKIGDFYPNHNHFQIGSRQVANDNFQGIIDEVRIWNRARTAEQIKTTWQDTLPPQYYATADSGLIGYWRFDETNEGEEGVLLVKDYSVNNNPGYIYGHVTLSELPTDIPRPVGQNPDQFQLLQNYPNPFNPTTNIEYKLREQAEVELNVYDMQGRSVARLFKGQQQRGQYRITWNGRNHWNQKLASGIYFYSLIVNGQKVDTRKMILVR